MNRAFGAGLSLLAGIALLVAALSLHVILLEMVAATMTLAGAGAVLTAVGAYLLRAELGSLLRRRRGEIALVTVGVIGVLMALAYLSVRYRFRFDLSTG
jgi:hypothetical protein